MKLPLLKRPDPSATGETAAVKKRPALKKLGRKKLIARTQIGHQSERKCMGSTGNLWSYQRIFGMKDICIHLFQRISSKIIVSIARCIVKAFCIHPCFLHGMNDLQLVQLCHLIDLIKTFFQ